MSSIKPVFLSIKKGRIIGDKQIIKKVKPTILFEDRKTLLHHQIKMGNKFASGIQNRNNGMEKDVEIVRIHNFFDDWNVDVHQNVESFFQRVISGLL